MDLNKARQVYNNSKARYFVRLDVVCSNLIYLYKIKKLLLI